MKLSALEYFIAVAEAGSITAAAQKLHVAQPSLTKSLQSLEQEIGIQLLHRSSTGVCLTEGGRKVLSDARQIVLMYHSWREFASLSTLREIDIYSHISLAGFLLPDVIFRFREKHPEIMIGDYTDSRPVRFISASAQKPVLVLNIGSTNHETQAFARVPGNHRQMLTKGAYGILTSASSPLAKKSVLTCSDLEGYYLALPNFVLKDLDTAQPPTTPIEAFLPRMISIISRSRIVEVESVSSVIELVRQRPETYGVSFFPTHLRYSGVRTGELVHIRLAEQGVEGELSLIYSSRAAQAHPVLRELIKDVTEAYQRFCADVRME